MTHYPHGRKDDCGLSVKCPVKPHTPRNQKGELMSDPIRTVRREGESSYLALVIFLKNESEGIWESLVSRVLNLGIMAGFQSIFQP